MFVRDEFCLLELMLASPKCTGIEDAEFNVVQRCIL